MLGRRWDFLGPVGNGDTGKDKGLLWPGRGMRKTQQLFKFLGKLELAASCPWMAKEVGGGLAGVSTLANGGMRDRDNKLIRAYISKWEVFEPSNYTSRQILKK